MRNCRYAIYRVLTKIYQSMCNSRNLCNFAFLYRKIAAMTFTALAMPIFEQVIKDYHQTNDVDAKIQNPYPAGTIEADLYLKNWIDTVQWHLEDIIRDPNIDPVEALALKRRIDRSNQERTDLVETKIIDGRQYILIEVNDNIEVNGINVHGVNMETGEIME